MRGIRETGATSEFSLLRFREVRHVPWGRPTEIMYLPDIVVFLVPGLKYTLREAFSMMEAGYNVSYSRWGFHSWASERHALTLEIAHQGLLHFSLLLEPQIWGDVLPAIMQAKTIGIVGDRRYFHSEERNVTPFYLDEYNVCHLTMYKVFEADASLRKIIPVLEDLQQRWNPKGVVTYLLATLQGSAAE